MKREFQEDMMGLGVGGGGVGWEQCVCVCVTGGGGDGGRVAVYSCHGPGKRRRMKNEKITLHAARETGTVGVTITFECPRTMQCDSRGNCRCRH